MPLLPDSENALSRLLYERFQLLPFEPANLKRNPLFGLPLICVARAVFLIASQQDGKLDTTGKFLGAKTNGQRHEQLLRAFAVFESWPRKFHKFLSEYQGHKQSKFTTGLDTSFGSFYRVLYNGRSLPQPLTELLKNEFQNYVLNHWEDGYASRTKWSKSAKTDAKYTTMVRASHTLRTEYFKVQRLVAQGKLRAVVTKKGRTKLVLVESKSVEELKEHWQRYTSLQDASKLLGISQLNILALVGTALLADAQAPSTDNNNTWRFDRTVLERFLQNVLAKTVRPAQSIFRKLHSFNTVLRLLSRKVSNSGEVIHILIEDIINGQLTPREKSPDKAGVSGLYFYDHEVRAYVKMKLPSAKNRGFRIVGGAKELGLKRATAYFLAKKGLIETTTSKYGNRRCQEITQNAVNKFNLEFVLATAIAHTIGTSVRFLVNALQTIGIAPISGRSVDLGGTYIFRRKDLEKINLRELVDRLQPNTHVPIESTILSQAEAAKILRVSEETIPELLDNGVLKLHRKSSGSNSVFFYRRTVERYRRQFSSLENLISINAAASRLQISRHTLFHIWIRLGYLKFEISTDGKQRLLRKSEVEPVASFLNEAVNMKEAALLLRVSTHYIKKWATRKWLKPLVNPYPRAFRGNVYSRTQLALLRVNHEPVGVHMKTLSRVQTVA